MGVFRRAGRAMTAAFYTRGGWRDGVSSFNCPVFSRVGPMRRVPLITLLCLSTLPAVLAQAPSGRSAAAPAERARNVILFIGDAGGLPTLHAASLYGYDRPQALFIQKMPNIALMDTSPADRWVTDSAAGMTAIVTGQKTNDGVLSQSAGAVRGKKDGEPLKTILEYAEERGLSTGVITNDSVAGATPAACYAQVNDRNKTAAIMAQLVKPRAGNGVDLALGSGRSSIYRATAAAGVDLDATLRASGYALLRSPEDVRPDTTRALGLTDASDYNLSAVVANAIASLSRNPKGYFLMVEWDMHTDNLKRGLDRGLVLDKMMRQIASKVKDDTLIIFAADHSFDLLLRGGRIGESLLPVEGRVEKRPRLAAIDGSHTAEEVVVAAKGPGAERVRGFMPNTQLFHIMMAAYGWKESPQASR